MKLELNDNWLIDTDEHNWRLHFRPDGVNEKTGKPYKYTIIGYYANLPQCMKAILDKKISGAGVDKIQEIFVEYERLVDKVERLKGGK